MLGSKLGEVIDSQDVVIRFNNAPAGETQNSVSFHWKKLQYDLNYFCYVATSFKIQSEFFQIFTACYALFG